MHEETKVEIRKQGCLEMPMKLAVSLEACHSLVSSQVIESFSLHPGSWDHSVLSLSLHSRRTQRHKFGTGFVMKVCQCFWVFMIKRKTIVVETLQFTFWNSCLLGVLQWMDPDLEYRYTGSVLGAGNIVILLLY